MDTTSGKAGPGASPAPSGASPAPAAVATKRQTVIAVLADFLERAGWSAGEQFFAVLFTTTTVVTVAGLPWAAASVMAVGAAIVSILTTGLQYIARLNFKNYWADLALRLVKTFLSSLLGAMGAQATFNFLHFNWIAALNLAAVATLAALGKGLLARNSFGTPNPSTLPVDIYNSAVAVRVWR